MAHKNKVLNSFNLEGEGRCVDVFVRPDGSFGFEEYRHDAEDGQGWFPVGFHADQRFDTRELAAACARETVAWLEEVMLT